MRKNRTRLKAFILSSLVFFTTTLTALAVGTQDNWIQVGDGFWQDTTTGDFIYQTTDREKTSDIFYRTQGFTFADGYKDENGNIVDSGNYEFTVSLNNEAIHITDVNYVGDPKNKIIQTTWVIPQSYIMEQIASTSPEWYNKVLNPQGEVYLKMDPILAVYDKNKFDGNDDIGYWSGWLNADGTWYEGSELWDKYNWEELKTLYGWADPSWFDNHYNKALLISLGLLEDGNNPFDMLDGSLMLPSVTDKTPSISNEMVDIIGKYGPEYYTYNYDPTGQFNIGDGIPTSELVTNGYEADEWYGWSGISKRSGATHSWNFAGNINYKETVHAGHDFNPITNQYEDKYIEISRHEPYSYTVSRTVRYWYLDTCAFFDLNTVNTKNEVFPGRAHDYSSNRHTDIQCSVNGIDLTSVSGINYTPNDDYHVDWPQITSAQARVDASGDSREDAISSFRGIAESRILPAGEIYVRNDELIINGKTYMSGGQYQYKHFHENKGEPNTYNGIGSNDYGTEKDERTGAIPKDTANDVYETTITANYKQLVVNTGAIKSFTKSPSNSGIGDRILSGYTGNEGVVVHTPTISPVIIVDPITHEKIEIANTDFQLVTSAVNSDAEYQLLLDGTYTIKFVPEEHFEHIGYPEMAPDLYNKYCKFKQCAFPFTMQLDGKIYTPDDNTEDSDGNPKLEGYTEWIDLPDFTIDDFYIPSWTTEGPDYKIKFRVAPENVIDQYGVDHIDDEEYLKNATLEGVPLYNYVSTYDITAQVSGRIYDFQAVGVNDRDFFEGLVDDEKSNGFGYLVQNYPFCPTKQEKRSGTLNRLGGSSVRYTVDGTLTNNWDERNTLPFSNGRSQWRKGLGTLRRGNSFAFSVKTMANLWDEEGDYLVIKPTFRYVYTDGTVDDSVDVYATILSADGSEELSFVEYGSDIDTANFKTTSISDGRFDGSYYSEDLSIPRVLTQDDIEFSRKMTNRFLYMKNIEDIPTYPQEAYVNNNAYLRREGKCYCLSKIIIPSDLRLLTGNIEQLERNLDKEGTALTYVEDKLDTGASYFIKEATNPELWEMHRKSMQTWYATYYLPNQLYVTDDVFEADADGDGTPEQYDRLWDYTLEKGYLEGNEDFFKKTGYLVVNFQIMTVNNNTNHLLYYGSNSDQWQIEGAPDKVMVGDEHIGEGIEVDVKSGDVAILDLERSTMDMYYVGFNRIN